MKGQHSPRYLAGLHVIESLRQLLEGIALGDQIVQLKLPRPIEFHQHRKINARANRAHEGAEQPLILEYKGPSRNRHVGLGRMQPNDRGRTTRPGGHERLSDRGGCSDAVKNVLGTPAG